MNRDKLLEQIRKAVREVEPEAEITLYGFRSRGDALAESDRDLLILVNGARLAGEKAWPGRYHYSSLHGSVKWRR